MTSEKKERSKPKARVMLRMVWLALRSWKAQLRASLAAMRTARARFALAAADAAEYAAEDAVEEAQEIERLARSAKTSTWKLALSGQRRRCAESRQAVRREKTVRARMALQAAEEFEAAAVRAVEANWVAVILEEKEALGQERREDGRGGGAAGGGTMN